MNKQRTAHKTLLAILILFQFGGPGAKAAGEDAILQRLLALEENQRRLEQQLAERDARVRELEARLGVGPGATGELQSFSVVPQAGADRAPRL